MMSKDGGSKKKFYLLGTDYVFPRTANKVLKAFLKAKGVPDENIAEEYTPFGHSDYQTIVGKVKEFAKDGDACILSTINGDSNVPFYKEFANQGLTADKCPIMAFSVAEDELRSIHIARQSDASISPLVAVNLRACSRPFCPVVASSTSSTSCGASGITFLAVRLIL